MKNSICKMILIFMAFAVSHVHAYDYTEDSIVVGNVFSSTSYGFYRFTRSSGTFSGCSSNVMYMDPNISDRARSDFLTIITSAKLSGRTVKVFWSVDSGGVCRMDLAALE